jgi:hypothetical protein
MNIKLIIVVLSILVLQYNPIQKIKNRVVIEYIGITDKPFPKIIIYDYTLQNKKDEEFYIHKFIVSHEEMNHILQFKDFCKKDRLSVLKISINDKVSFMNGKQSKNYLRNAFNSQIIKNIGLINRVKELERRMGIE